MRNVHELDLWRALRERRKPNAEELGGEKITLRPRASYDRHCSALIVIPVWWAADLCFAHGRREPRCAPSSSPQLPQRLRRLPVTSVARGQIELRQSPANLLGLPILIAVCLLAVIVRQLFVHPPSAIVLGVCAAAAALDIVLVVYLLRNMGSTLVVTADDITFTRRRRRGPAPQQVIQRAAGSTLSFRVGANGPVGLQYTGYVLKLRDNATGKEVYAGAFGRRKVQQACESQGWSFS
jgi:hypothetical protein